MINSHKELVSEIKKFTEKFELINDFIYLKDVDSVHKEAENSKPRMFILALDSMIMDDENYNLTMTYNFILSDETIYKEKSIIETESENLECVSALGDYLKYIADAYVDFRNLETTTESIGENTYVTVSGSFDFIIKRKPSYWKKMEDYSV